MLRRRTFLLVRNLHLLQFSKKTLARLNSNKTSIMTSANVEDIAVTRFREYLRINTSHPNPDYAQASSFYSKYAGELDLTYTQVKLPQNRTADLITWEGLEPSLPSIMLYSHTDVVPTFPEHWKYDPFSAHKEDNGDIYARGSQDMKCVGIQYLEAIRKLKTGGQRFKRTFHVTFCPDEEIGGQTGMIEFVKTKEFEKMNVGFALDEGLANPGDELRVFYGERNVWWLEVTCPGSPGHGSSFLTNTAAEKVQKIINTLLSFRAEQEKKLQEDSSLALGDVVSVNLTMLKGGVQYNVVPDHMIAGFDIRVPPTADLIEFDNRVTRWCQEAGSGVTIKYHHKTMDYKITVLNQSNPWWVAFEGACSKAGVKLKKEIFPAGTDGRSLRKKDIPVLGFSPMNHTEVLLHDHNEHLNEGTFLRGVDLYTHILAAVANV
uniref:N-acyl-aliphatic-L-amino acid amidohydrolase n=2 Tax=Arion vulgaris TaxID=1028688 RepID=A0A0B7A130_9EUPU